MALVTPVFIPTPPTSERARRLSAELVKTVEEFRRRDPQTNEFDVRQALLLASRTVDRSRSARIAAVLAGVGLALLLGLALSLRESSRGDSPGGTAVGIPWVALVALAVVAAVALTVFLRRRE